MSSFMFHIFRNSPLGRENLLQSIYFCKTVKRTALFVYLPETKDAILYCDSGAITISLDASYIRFAGTAKQRAEDILRRSGIPYDYFIPTSYTAKVLADVPTDWSIIACPRVISEASSRIGYGHLGPKVRQIVKDAPFPVFIACSAYKPWTSVAVFFGGSDLGLRAVKLARHIARRAAMPLTIYTQADTAERKTCEQRLKQVGLVDLNATDDCRWVVFESGTFEENLMEVPFDSLIVAGAAGTSIIQELVFGSKLELIQSAMPNPMVVLGPNSKSYLCPQES